MHCQRDTAMFAIARDPHWLFTYWDFDYAKFPTPRKLFLEVYRNEDSNRRSRSTDSGIGISRSILQPRHTPWFSATVMRRMPRQGWPRTDSDASRIGGANWDTIRDGALSSELHPCSTSYVCATAGQPLMEALARLSRRPVAVRVAQVGELNRCRSWRHCSAKLS